VQSGGGTTGGKEKVSVMRFQTREGYWKGMGDRWGCLRPDLDVAKKTDARVAGSLVKLVCAVLFTKVYKLSFSLEKIYKRSQGRNVP